MRRLCRVILALTFLWAGLAKVGSPEAFASQIAGYHVVPDRLLTLVALALPEVEVLAGACLLLGLLVESSALVLGLLSLAFAGSVAGALVRGLDIECGCFGGAQHVGPGHLLLDLALVGLAVGVLYRRRDAGTCA